MTTDRCDLRCLDHLEADSLRTPGGAIDPPRAAVDSPRVMVAAARPAAQAPDEAVR